MAFSGPERREAVGEAFSSAAMFKAQDLTFEALRRIAAAIQPGDPKGMASRSPRPRWKPWARTASAVSL